MNTLPPARTENIVMQDFDDEVLLYDLVIDKAYCLNDTMARIYRCCNGAMNLVEFKARHGDIPEESIFLALDHLSREGLLEKTADKSPFDGLSRRELVKQAGLASAIALPVILSLVAPNPGFAASVMAPCTLLAPGMNTNWSCNFGPQFPGSAAFCDQIECSMPGRSRLDCCSGMTHAVLNPALPNFYTCRCD